MHDILPKFSDALSVVGAAHPFKRIEHHMACACGLRTAHLQDGIDQFFPIHEASSHEPLRVQNLGLAIRQRPAAWAAHTEQSDREFAPRPAPGCLAPRYGDDRSG